MMAPPVLVIIWGAVNCTASDSTDVVVTLYGLLVADGASGTM